MKKNIVRTLFIILAIVSASTACVRDNFNYYGYEDQLEGYFPVDEIDPDHSWTLTSNCSSGVSGIPSGSTKVQILSGNPFTDDGVEVMAEVLTSTLASQYANINYVSSPHISTVYAIALDEDGACLAMGSATLNQEIKLSTSVPATTMKETTTQALKYCFEADYPNPGDWDYNDIVLSISKELKDDEPTVVALHVKLEAVGYLTQIAAAIRLVGYDNNKVKITQDESTTFVSDASRQRLFITKQDVQFAAINGNAVINLFDDAHLAIYHAGMDGNPYRRFFNTFQNPNASNKGATQSPVTVTYYIDFGDNFTARNFQLTELDPFILVQYGTAGTNFWEVHTYPYKLTESIYNYYHDAAASYANKVSWALVIPDKDFLYPLEAEPIGMRKNTIVSGAYQEKDHSFGEWILDQTTARDWYRYPVDGAVYISQ